MNKLQGNQMQYVHNIQKNRKKNYRFQKYHTNINKMDPSLTEDRVQIDFAEKKNVV